MIACEGLAWRCWEGDYILYNPLSGNTHRLDLLTGEICLFLQGRSKELPEIYAFAANFLEVDLSGELKDSVEAAIDGLDQAGLIEWRT